jgi:hypothetical protein
LEVLGAMRKLGCVELLVVLPDGSKTLMPAAWTDHVSADGTGAADPISATLAAPEDLLRASVLVRSLSARATTVSEQAARKSPTKENERAACTAESDTATSPGASPGGDRLVARGRTRRRDQDPGAPDGEGGRGRAGAR